jgi:hypothetical protein
MKKAPEYYRIKTGVLASDVSVGNNGAFAFPHYKVSNYDIFCMVSDGMGWEHVSVTITPNGKNATRCPTWEEMCWVKDQFWNKDECVVQYHPVESEYVSYHPFCLHLWKPTDQSFPTPPSIMVGPKSPQKLGGRRS